MKAFYSDEGIEVFLSNALDLLRSLDGGSVALVFADPPYKGVKKDLAWDNQWKNDGEFLAWIGALCDEFKRVLAPNGSLYLCASPAMAWAVEGQVRGRFNVLNSVRWVKSGGYFRRMDIEICRQYLQPWESIIFAEQWGADGDAMNQGGYLSQSDKLRGFVFEPIRAYLDEERKQAGFTGRDGDRKMRQALGVSLKGGGLLSHFWGRSQWQLPTREHYEVLQKLFNNRGEYKYLRRDYEDLRREYEDLRREYEDLRREYEDLRRPFFLSKDRPTTDLWTYEPVAPDDTKHETEKPLQMLLDIVETSSRPGDLVADPFLGRGATAIACQRLGRRFIGCDFQEHWVKATKARLLEAKGEMHLRIRRPETVKARHDERQVSMFDLMESE